MKSFVITKFNSLFIARDLIGRKVKFINRKSACFIITTKGKIRFTYADGHLISQPGTPVFLPKGLSYLNECLETAESFVFNFETLNQDTPPMELCSIEDSVLLEYYEQIRSHTETNDLSSQILIFKALYSLAYKLIGPRAKTNIDSPIVAKAIHFISQNYGSPEITVSDVARHCSVSEVYLRKLFENELHISPYRKITEMRMNKAKTLIEEKRPLKEIADSVGYSDVFQFSKAYKRYFGHSPKKSNTQIQRSQR